MTSGKIESELEAPLITADSGYAIQKEQLMELFEAENMHGIS